MKIRKSKSIIVNDEKITVEISMLDEIIVRSDYYDSDRTAVDVLFDFTKLECLEQDDSDILLYAYITISLFDAQYGWCEGDSLGVIDVDLILHSDGDMGIVNIQGRRESLDSMQRLSGRNRDKYRSKEEQLELINDTLTNSITHFKSDSSEIQAIVYIDS